MDAWCWSPYLTNYENGEWLWGRDQTRRLVSVGFLGSCSISYVLEISVGYFPCWFELIMYAQHCPVDFLHYQNLLWHKNSDRVKRNYTWHCFIRIMCVHEVKFKVLNTAGETPTFPWLEWCACIQINPNNINGRNFAYKIECKENLHIYKCLEYSLPP